MITLRKAMARFDADASSRRSGPGCSTCSPAPTSSSRPRSLPT
jgi:hypothetical protein